MNDSNTLKSGDICVISVNGVSTAKIQEKGELNEDRNINRVIPFTLVGLSLSGNFLDNN